MEQITRLHWRSKDRSNIVDNREGGSLSVRDLNVIDTRDAVDESMRAEPRPVVRRLLTARDAREVRMLLCADNEKSRDRRDRILRDLGHLAVILLDRVRIRKAPRVCRESLKHRSACEIEIHILRDVAHH